MDQPIRPKTEAEIEADRLAEEQAHVDKLRSWDRHSALSAVVGERAHGLLNYDPADPDKMRLPVGQTCGDCMHIHRCKAMFGHVESDTSCDWSPSRFCALAASGVSGE